MKTINCHQKYLFNRSLEMGNSTSKNLNQFNIDDLPMHKQICLCLTFQNQINRLRGGGQTQDTRQMQQQGAQQNQNRIFNDQDIFQYLQYYTTFLQGMSENYNKKQEMDELKTVFSWMNSKGIINKLSKQDKLNDRKIEIIKTSIDSILSCVMKTSEQISYSLLQFTQILFQTLYQQVKNKPQILNIFQDQLQQITQKYKSQKGLDILFNYQLGLMNDVVDYKSDDRVSINQKYIFQQIAYQNQYQNEVIYQLFQDAQMFLLNVKSHQYDIYYFFQQLKLTIISVVLNQQQKIQISQIASQLCKGYQLCIQNSQNWRVHLGFLQMLLELISYENSFIEDLQNDSTNDILIVLFNELSTYLISFGIQDNINIWEHYIRTRCNSTIKCYLAFSLIRIIIGQNTQNVKQVCQDYINLFFKSDQDEYTLSILKNEKLKDIKEIFEPTQIQNQQLNLYKQFLKTNIEKIQEEFIFNDQELNQIKIQLNVLDGNNINYLFKEVANCSDKQEIFQVNDFLWKENNNTEIMMIEGRAGSGKSNFLRRLQLFLLKHHNSNSKQKKWIPLFIQLATLKEPYDNIWSQIFKDYELQKNNEFIQNLNDDVKNGQVNVLLLFDGLDDIKHDIKLDILLQKNTSFYKKLGKNVKIIVTSREALIDTQFMGQNFKFLAQLKIPKLNEEQIKDYLQQYCVEVIRQYLYQIYKKIPISKLQFNQYWEAFFLEEIRTTNIWSDEHILNLHSKLEKIFNQQLDYSQFLSDFKNMQSQDELYNKIKNKQVIDLIQTPQSLQIILEILSSVNQVQENRKNRKARFKKMLLKLTNDKIKSINQLEQAKTFNQNEYIENLMIKLDENKFFDHFSFEKLHIQIAEDQLNLIKLAIKSTELTQYQIYKLFVSQYYNKQIHQLKNLGRLNIIEHLKNKNDLNKLNMVLAAHMIQQKSLDLDSKQVESIVKSFFNQKNFDDGYIMSLWKSAPLKVENRRYTFLNNSIQQYYAGKYILRFLKDFSRDFKEKSIELNLEQSQFNQKEFNLSFNQFNQVLNCIKSELLSFSDIKSSLIKIIKQSRDERFIRAASNSIFMINFLRLELIGEDLRGIKLSKTNLSGLNFFGSNLDESVFNEVLIDYCNFNNTSLQKVKWVQTPWNEVKVFKDQNLEKIIDMQFSPNYQYLISWSNFSVNIWSLQTEKICKRLNYNLNLKSCVFSFDSTKLLLDFVKFQQIYRINNNDITLLITIPQTTFIVNLNLKSLFAFYNKQEKILCKINNLPSIQGLSINLENLIQSQQEWSKKQIFDYSTQFTFVKQLWSGELLIGTLEGQIKMWDNGNFKIISENDHNSAIVSLSQDLGQKYDPTTGLCSQSVEQLISVSEKQVIVWVVTNNIYQKVTALPQHKINGQLPRYLNFNGKDLVYIRDKYIIFYDLKKIDQLKYERKFENSHCMAINISEQTFYYNLVQERKEKYYRLFIAKDNCIEIYEDLQACKAKIPLNNCQPLSMHFCSPSYLITYNKDRTIRFFYVDVVQEDLEFIHNDYERKKQMQNQEHSCEENQHFHQMQMQNQDFFQFQNQHSFQMQNQDYSYQENQHFHQMQMQNYQMQNQSTQWNSQQHFKNSRLLKGFIKGDVQNLKQSWTQMSDGTLKIAVQENKKQINIYRVELSQTEIKFEKINKVKCLEDENIGCFALSSDGTKICLGVDNIVQIRNLENDARDKLEEIHEKDIDKIMFNQNEQYLVSCSQDNLLIIWNKDYRKIFGIKNQKCLDLVFDTEDVLIIQTQNSIIWYQIKKYSITEVEKADVQIIRYLDYEERGIDNILLQQMDIVQPLIQSKTPQNDQYLAIKQGNNIILKHYFKDDQTKIVILDEQQKKIVFANKDYIIYQMESSNTLQIMNIKDDMEIIQSLEFCAFTIRERYESEKFSYILIAVETKNEIRVMQIKENNQITTENIKISQGNQTHLTLSDFGNFLAFTNNQEIAIHYITDQFKIILLSKFTIDMKIKNIQISENYKIIIEGENCLYLYQLNIEAEQLNIEAEQNYYFNKQNQYYIRLNHNDKQLAIKSENQIDFISLSNRSNLYLDAEFFSISTDSKYFIISSKKQIQYFDWQEQIKRLYSFNYEYNLFQLMFLNDPNEIVAITNDNIQIFQCKENQIKQIKGIYSGMTRVSRNLDVAKIQQQSLISISKPEVNYEFQNLEDFEQKTKNPQFTQDGQYLIYESNNNVIFQSLQQPDTKYIPEKLKGQMNVSILSESNYLITFQKNQEWIHTQFCGKQVDEFYLNVWDVSILSDVKLLFQLPILQPQNIKIANHQCFISGVKDKNHILCVYEIKKLLKDVYDKPLFHDNKNLHLQGICPQETKFYSVLKGDYSISIWEMKTQQNIKVFKGPHKSEIIFVGFSEDEKYMISRDKVQIIVWNMLSEEYLQIPLQIQNIFSILQNQTINYSQDQCSFVQLDNSLGVAIKSQGELYIYDLKDFKSYELYYKRSVNPDHSEDFKYKVYSNGSKLSLKLKLKGQKEDEIIIFDVRKKKDIETIILQEDECLFSSPDSDIIFKKKIDKKYNIIGNYNELVHLYSKDTNLLQIYRSQDFKFEGVNPLHEVFIHINTDYYSPNTYDSLIQLNYVGKKYITYFFNKQLRVIDLELYKQQVKLIKLDESEKFLPFYYKDQIIVEKSNGNRYFYNWKDCRKVNENQEDEWDIEKFVVAFSNDDGKQLAQGWNDGDIIILKYNQAKKEYIQIKNLSWSSGNQAIKNLQYTKDDKILISISNNIISFWNLIVKGELIQQELIQQIKFDLEIQSIVISPNGFDIALELEGDQIQILTIDQSKCYSQNQNQKYIGCYKSYPKLQEIMTENCILGNSIIEDQKQQSLVHHFGGIVKHLNIK